MVRDVLVAVSGGPDSMHLLHKLNINSRLNPIVLHVNYGLRSESDSEEEMIKLFCRKNNLTFFTFNLNSSNKYDNNIKNKQSKYRKIRYDFFKEIAADLNIDILYVGHNKDDFIETAIMQEEKSKELLFYGIKDNEIDGINIKRPLLKIYKDKILIKNIKKKIPFKIDKSNFEDTYERNRIRKNLSLLNLKEKNKIYDTFVKLNKSNEVELRRVNREYDKFIKEGYSIAFLKTSNNSIEILRRFLLSRGLQITITTKKLNSIQDFIFGTKDKKYKLMENVFLLRNEGKIIVMEENNGNRK
jgi:tRNA(Ile)-lysidine synthase